MCCDVMLYDGNLLVLVLIQSFTPYNSCRKVLWASRIKTKPRQSAYCVSRWVSHGSLSR